MRKMWVCVMTLLVYQQVDEVMKSSSVLQGRQRQIRLEKQLNQSLAGINRADQP